MDTGVVLSFAGGYIAAVFGVFLIYSPVLVLVVVLLLTAGVVQLLAWPFVVVIRKLRRRRHPEPPSDGSWLLH